MASNDTLASANLPVKRTAFGILGAISVAHLLNDMIQSLILAIYPLLQSDFSLSFVQIGMITLTYQVTASLLQPLIGYYTDKHPQPWSLPIGMGFTLSGLVLLAMANNFPMVLVAAALVGTGSSVFHPESSRVARMASGGRHGLAQSLFQVGGNLGSSLGPLLAALIIAPYGRGNVAWFSLAALLAIVVLLQIGRWYQTQHRASKSHAQSAVSPLPRRQVALAISILLVLILLQILLSHQPEQLLHLLSDAQVWPDGAERAAAPVRVSVRRGGRDGDWRADRRPYWPQARDLGVHSRRGAVEPLLLPHANLWWTGALSVVIGFILASAFSAILVYAQELMPGRIGMVSGLFFGFAFGMGGLGAAVLGLVADHSSIDVVYQICAYLPLLGILTAFLPDNRRK